MTTDDRYAPTAFRASDHDPALVGLNLAADPGTTRLIVTADIPAAVNVGEAYMVDISEASPVGSATLPSLTVNWGDDSAAGSYDVMVTLTDSRARRRPARAASPSVSWPSSAAGRAPRVLQRVSGRRPAQYRC
ncbi:hypothetical protein [Xylophilus sp. GOD-11R]|uniref:hypothetical protein n=1 Tax=Xylophilus sp. GOD-11R TaxID=3089814 RepID=UPI00298D0318|nr:hypothetical protein [Xylophilus sp. GOD-11R]WPB58249.1 hypothetical protein R9X41_06300 [Xylophilus sp. GOD-11R]